MSMLAGVDVPGGGANGVLLSGKAGMEGARKLDRIAMAQDVHVERHGLGAQQMVVQRGDLDAAFARASS